MQRTSKVNETHRISSNQIGALIRLCLYLRGSGESKDQEKLGQYIFQSAPPAGRNLMAQLLNK
jgi:hypothetical protein